MKDVAYSELKKNERAYEIMLLKDQNGNTFADIAKEFGISVVRARQIYVRQKIKQKNLYINHITSVLGHNDTSQVRKVYEQADNCYQNRTYACAYLEKKYKEILDEYRNGEPGMPKEFIKSIPPLRGELSRKTINRIVEMHEVENATFVDIGKELHITPEKAKHSYGKYYSAKTIDVIAEMESRAKSNEEKMNILRIYSGKHNSPKKLYEMMHNMLEDNKDETD